VPEFLREGAAVTDFHDPPKTVIGTSDARTAATLTRIFEPVDAAPLTTGIETAELVKYVDNVWHAAKVCFGNEVGRLAKSMGLDGREVMDIFCQDTKLNISPAYLRPGFAYGGSCLPKEVRAVSWLGARNGVSLPMVESLERSNAAQIAEALRLVRATGARRVGVLGLAFKPGTDDLRESPILEVMAALMDDGVALTAHDPAITPATLATRRRADAVQGRPAFAARLPEMLAESAEAVIAGTDAVIIAHPDPRYRAALEGARARVIDLAGLFETRTTPRACEGIGW
jgi:GDP-mannose 6-dehydrogenase